MHKKNMEKSKDFKRAMKRLFSELSRFRFIIIIALILAIISSILSIVSPKQLSKLTDEISYGLIINKDNLVNIKDNIENNLKNIDMESIMSANISLEEKQSLANVLNSNLDQRELIKSFSELSDSVKSLIFKEFIINDVKITYKDQIKFLDVFGKIDDYSNVNKIYESVDELPLNIYNLVKPNMNMPRIKTICLFLVGLYIISALFTFIESIIMTIVSNKFAYYLRNRISLKINKLPLKFFDKNQVGDTLSRVTNDVDTIAQTMNSSLATLVTSITLFIGTLIMMFITNYIMALTAIVSSFIGFIFMSKVLSKSQKYFKDRQKSLGELNSHIEEIYSNLLVVKAYNGKDESNKEFNKLNKKVYEANRKSQFLGGLMPTSMMFIGNFGYVAVCIVGALLTQNNMITFGVIVAFMTYIRLFTQPLSQIAQSLTALQSSAAASERVFEFLDEEEMTKESASITLDKNMVKGDITFEHIKFGYDEKLIIKDFNASIKAGQKVAIVGPTGAGKTTMVNLLMKFYDIKSGDIKIDGVSIKDLSRENIHSLFTMVLQDTWLFSGTIKENIVFNRKNVSLAKVKDACENVGITNFINTLPNTYDYEFEESELISSGQKQLLTIARAMIEDSPFLILDEATSNVDTRTEELVSKAMDKLIKNKTSFIIAHRLSTIKNADIILVMKDGNIVEQGSHDDLLKLNGFYAELYNSQFQN